MRRSAVASAVGAEPVTYVSNIVKTVVAFQLAARQAEDRRRALETNGRRRP